MAIFILGRGLSLSSFQGFPVSTSGSRPAVAERPGAKTQLTGVTGAVLIILMIVFLPGLFRNPPQPVLAAVLITASLSFASPLFFANAKTFRDKTGADWTAADVAGPYSAGPYSAGIAQPAVDPTARP